MDALFTVLKRIAPSHKDDRPWYGRLGDGVNEEKIQALVNAGYGYTIQGGSRTTPITGAGAYVSTTPDMDILVPGDKAFIPLFISVTYETSGTSLLQEIIATAGLGGAQGTTTSVTPTNMITSMANSSGLTAFSPSTGTTLMTQNLTDIWRDGAQFTISKTSASATVSSQDQAKFVYRAKDEGVYHVLKMGNGLAARLNIWGAAQAPTLFIIVKGLCVPVEWTDPQ